MAPNLATSAPKRFAGLLALCVASAVMFAMTRPEPAQPQREYKLYKRIGYCKDGKWVHAPAPYARFR